MQRVEGVSVVAEQSGSAKEEVSVVELLAVEVEVEAGGGVAGVG